jgi:hypothetical protein
VAVAARQGYIDSAIACEPATQADLIARVFTADNRKDESGRYETPNQIRLPDHGRR